MTRRGVFKEGCGQSELPENLHVLLPNSTKRRFDADVDHVYAVTLSAELSGSYNSAQLGRNLLLEEKPDKKIYVFNSRSASVGETLIAMKIEECEEQGMAF